MKTTFVSAVCLTAAIAAYATCDKSLDDFPALPGEDADRWEYVQDEAGIVYESPAGGLDARKIDRITLFYGIWLCPDSAERPHGFEVSSIRIVGRDAH